MRSTFLGVEEEGKTISASAVSRAGSGIDGHIAGKPDGTSSISHPTLIDSYVRNLPTRLVRDLICYSHNHHSVSILV